MELSEDVKVLDSDVTSQNSMEKVSFIIDTFLHIFKHLCMQNPFSFLFQMLQKNVFHFPAKTGTFIKPYMIFVFPR